MPKIRVEAEGSRTPFVLMRTDDVVAGKASMSQRVVTSVEKHGGVDALVTQAKERGVHLLRLTNDEGRELIAASMRPFRTLC